MTAAPDDKAHSELGASIAARWMACPGSVALSRGQPNYETDHSRAGTVAHYIGEQCLRKRKLDPSAWLGTTVNAVAVDEGMVAAVRVYVDYCRGLMQEPDADWRIEHTFDLASLNPPAPMFGTSDFAIVKPHLRELEIVDYKNGSGVVVDVKGNKQLRYYALGVALSMNTAGIDTVKMTIVQPNAPHADGVVRSDTMDYLDLLAFASDLLAAARRTQLPDAPLVSGSHCRFCPASAICPAQRDHAQAVAQVAFADMPLDTPPAPDTLPPDVLADILDKLPILEDWATSVRAYAMHEAEQGRPPLRRKLVAGKRGNRKWKDEDAARGILLCMGLDEEEISKPAVLKSPAQVEKLLSKPQKIEAAALVEQSEGKPMLVRDTDPRPALLLSPGDAFMALPAGE